MTLNLSNALFRILEFKFSLFVMIMQYHGRCIVVYTTQIIQGGFKIVTDFRHQQHISKMTSNAVTGSILQYFVNDCRTGNLWLISHLLADTMRSSSNKSRALFFRTSGPQFLLGCIHYGQTNLHLAPWSASRELCDLLPGLLPCCRSSFVVTPLPALHARYATPRTPRRRRSL